jgi:hypothetical protein
VKRPEQEMVKQGTSPVSFGQSPMKCTAIGDGKAGGFEHGDQQADRIGTHMGVIEPERLAHHSRAIVMAGGIFALAALQELPFPGGLITRLLALELLVIWVCPWRAVGRTPGSRR